MVSAEHAIATNGLLAAADIPPLVAPRIIRRTQWVELDPEDYPGMTIQYWLNPPNLVHRALVGSIRRPGQPAATDEETAAAEAALRRIVLAHNGWCDDEGEPLPPVTAAGFWDAIPLEIATLIAARALQGMSDLPNSLRAKLAGSNGGSAPETSGA